MMEPERERNRGAVRRYRARNLEKVRERNRLAKRRVRETPEGRELARETHRRWWRRLSPGGRKKLAANSKKWREGNSERFAQSCKEWRERKKNDPYYRMVRRLRFRLRDCLRGTTFKTATTMKLVGCSRDVLIRHIETQFLDGMSWDNIAEWHIDHIKPCCQFDLSDPDQQKECFHYTNLQPLWAKDNLSKGGRTPQQLE